MILALASTVLRHKIMQNNNTLQYIVLRFNKLLHKKGQKQGGKALFPLHLDRKETRMKRFVTKQQRHVEDYV